MTKERKKLISYLIVVIMLFGTGFGLGYYLWGVDREQKPDYKKYLSKTINYIGNLEKNNQGFIKQVKRLKADIATLKKDVKDAQIQFDAQSKSLQDKSASLEEEKARLQSLLGENQKLSKEKEQLQAKIDSLLGKNQDLAKEKEQLQAKIDQLINELDTVKQKIMEVESPVSEEKGPAEQEVESPVSEEKGPAEQEVESPVSEEKGQLEEKGHQSERLPGSSD